ncbi:MAG: molybdenum cofactor biosynthesis protein MoaE [Magnetococcales bacterium]|nr:molybdenum cofactor biosynthesis protein MoaE [Magnetococcales bacterium]
MIRIQKEDFAIGTEMARLTQGMKSVGGVVAFVGTVRDFASDHGQEIPPEEAVVALELEHYPGMTEGELEKIMAGARTRFNLEALLVIHRVGRLALEENIVLVVAAAAHRAEAFDGCRYVIDYLKVLATFWKKEILASGTERWVHSCPGCVAAASQWGEVPSVAHRQDGHCHHGEHHMRKHPVTKANWSGLAVGILTLSDSRDSTSDQSGAALAAMVTDYGAKKCLRHLLRDDVEAIARLLTQWSDEEKLDVIVTTGGTGPGPRDVTPEATRMVTNRELPGLAETIRREGLKQVRSALLSRGIAAFRGHTLMINLPGSRRGATYSLEVIADLVPHALSMAKGEGHG